MHIDKVAHLELAIKQIKQLRELKEPLNLVDAYTDLHVDNIYDFATLVTCRERQEEMYPVRAEAIIDGFVVFSIHSVSDEGCLE